MKIGNLFAKRSTVGTAIKEVHITINESAHLPIFKLLYVLLPSSGNL